MGFAELFTVFGVRTVDRANLKTGGVELDDRLLEAIEG